MDQKWGMMHHGHDEVDGRPTQISSSCHPISNLKAKGTYREDMQAIIHRKCSSPCFGSAKKNAPMRSIVSCPSLLAGSNEPLDLQYEHFVPSKGSRQDSGALTTLPHGPINGPISSAIIGPKGGHLEVLGNRLTVPPGALRDERRIELGLVWNDALRPAMHGSDSQMTAILSCEPSGLRFLKPVVLRLPHSLEVRPSRVKSLKPVLYTGHHKNGQTVWIRRTVGRGSFVFRDRTLEVQVQDFCYLVWADEEGNGIDAKRVRIVPYSTPIHQGQDQQIRLHIFDDVEGAKEKIRKEEEELGGKRLSAYASFVFLKNSNDMTLDLTWNTPGWVQCSPNIVMPFKEMWSFDHNSCELHLLNQTEDGKFKCNMEIRQSGNQSKVPLIFSHDIQNDSSNMSRLEAGMMTNDCRTSPSQDESTHKVSKVSWPNVQTGSNPQCQSAPEKTAKSQCSLIEELPQHQSTPGQTLGDSHSLVRVLPRTQNRSTPKFVGVEGRHSMVGPQQETAALKSTGPKLSFLQKPLPKVPPLPYIPSELLSLPGGGCVNRNRHSSGGASLPVQGNLCGLNLASRDRGGGQDVCDLSALRTECANDLSSLTLSVPTQDQSASCRDADSPGLTHSHQDALVPSHISPFLSWLKQGGKCLSPAEYGNNNALNVYHQNFVINMTKQTQGIDLYDSETPNVIPLSLKRKLGIKLDRDFDIGNWICLARHWDLENSCEMASNEKWPGFVILTLAEDKGIVKSLNDVIEAFAQIDRDDCIDLIKEYLSRGKGDSTEEQSQERTASDSSEEGMDCNVSPTGDAEESAFDLPGPLYQPGVDVHPGLMRSGRAVPDLTNNQEPGGSLPAPQGDYGHSPSSRSRLCGGDTPGCHRSLGCVPKATSCERTVRESIIASGHTSPHVKSDMSNHGGPLSKNSQSFLDKNSNIFKTHKEESSSLS